jgi:3-oxoacyl-[acyl-carrier protein] reductase
VARTRQVLISGGGTGIGLAVARRFVRSGDEVVIVGRRDTVLERAAEGLNESAGRHAARAIAADLSLASDVESLADEAPEDLDVLVNNAGGVVETVDTTLDDVEADWVTHLRHNVLSAVLLTTALLPRLRRRGSNIVNISSIAAVVGGGDSYSAAKAAILGWTLDLATRLGKDGVRVNAVIPGYISGTEFFADRMTAERHERLVERTLLGRAGVPDDVAAAVEFLASHASSYITGQFLHVNGGALLGR